MKGVGSGWSRQTCQLHTKQLHKAFNTIPIIQQIPKLTEILLKLSHSNNKNLALILIIGISLLQALYKFAKHQQYMDFEGAKLVNAP